VLCGNNQTSDSALAMATSGGLAQAFGTRPVLVGCGLLTAIAGLAGLAFRSIRRA